MTPWAETPRLAGVKVLLVEAVPDIRDVVTQALEEFGAQVTAVGSAISGLSLFKKQRPDVLISSVCLPEQDGYWLIRQVRGLAPEQGGRIPAVAFTGCTSHQDRLRALREGFQLHVPKPVDLRELAAAVALVSLRREGLLTSCVS